MKSQRLIGVTLVVGLIFGAASSCKKDNHLPIDFGYNYFPTAVGNWILYSVDSIYHDVKLLKHDTNQFQLKEIIESTFLDNAGRPAQRVERWRRANDTSAWHLTDAWVSVLTEKTAERVEENLRYIRLAFPVNRQQFWNGNALNVLDQWDHYYDGEALHIPRTLNGVFFDSTITVIQRENENKVERENALEIYAKNIGLVYKKFIDLDLDFTTAEITKGLEYTQTVISYGKQ